MAVAGDYFEEKVHVFEYFVVGGAAVKGASAKCVDGSSFAGCGGRMGDCAFEGSGDGFVYKVGGRGHESHCERCLREISKVAKRGDDGQTFDGEYRLSFRLFFLDAFEKSNHELCFLATNLFLRILRGQDVYVGLVALFSSLHGAAFPSEYFLYPVCKLQPPCVSRVFCTIAVEDFVDGTNTLPFH